MPRLKEGSKHSGDTELHSSVPLTAKSSACLEPCMLLGQRNQKICVKKMVGIKECFQTVVLDLGEQFGI